MKERISSSRTALGSGSCLFFALTLAGCWGEKEAEDPHQFLMEDLAEGHDNDIEPREPASTVTSPRAQPTSAAPAKAARRSALATRADCERAVRHMLVLGQKMQIEQEQDAEKRRELSARHKAELESAAVKQQIENLTRDCVDQGKTKRETSCIERVEREPDIDRCVE
jgi:hypothetical protein